MGFIVNSLTSLPDMKDILRLLPEMGFEKVLELPWVDDNFTGKFYVFAHPRGVLMYTSTIISKVDKEKLNEFRICTIVGHPIPKVLRRSRIGYSSYWDGNCYRSDLAYIEWDCNNNLMLILEKVEEFLKFATGDPVGQWELLHTPSELKELLDQPREERETLCRKRGKTFPPWVQKLIGLNEE